MLNKMEKKIINAAITVAIQKRRMLSYLPFTMDPIDGEAAALTKPDN